MRPVFRFAPSPNGHLHLGHAYSALLNFKAAQETGGTLRLRIDDIDQTRARKKYETQILSDLKWLGVSYDEPVIHQSARTHLYQKALERLGKKGVVYPAFLTRAQVARHVKKAQQHSGLPWPRDPDGVPLYPDTEKKRTARDAACLKEQGAAFSLRLDMQKALALIASPLEWQECANRTTAHTVLAEPALWGDIVLKGRNTAASYHLSVVIDDFCDGVTHVIRGMDLFAATSVHRVLQTLLDIQPPLYCHHRLITDETGEKLSKRAHALGLKALRAKQYQTQDVLRRIGNLEADIQMFYAHGAFTV